MFERKILCYFHTPRENKYETWDMLLIIEFLKPLNS